MRTGGSDEAWLIEECCVNGQEAATTTHRKSTEAQYAPAAGTRGRWERVYGCEPADLRCYFIATVSVRYPIPAEESAMMGAMAWRRGTLRGAPRLRSGCRHGRRRRCWRADCAPTR